MEKELTNQDLLQKIEELEQKNQKLSEEKDRNYKWWQDEELKTKKLSERLEKTERHLNGLLDLISK